MFRFKKIYLRNRSRTFRTQVEKKSSNLERYSIVASAIISAIAIIFSVYQFKRSVAISEKAIQQTNEQLKLSKQQMDFSINQFKYQKEKDSLDFESRKLTDSITKKKDSLNDYRAAKRFEQSLLVTKQMAEAQKVNADVMSKSTLPSINSHISFYLKDSLNTKVLINNSSIDNPTLNKITILNGGYFFFSNNYKVITYQKLPADYEDIYALFDLKMSGPVSKIALNKTINIYFILLVAYIDQTTKKEELLQLYYQIKPFTSVDKELIVLPVVDNKIINSLQEGLKMMRQSDFKSFEEVILPTENN